MNIMQTPDPYFYDENTGKWYELLYQPDGEPLNFIIDGNTVVMKPNAIPMGEAPFPDVLDEIQADSQDEVTSQPEPEKKKRGRPKKSQ